VTISCWVCTQLSIPSQENCNQSPAGVRPLGVNVWPRLRCPISGYSELGPDRTSTLSWFTVKPGAGAADAGASGGGGGGSCWLVVWLLSCPDGRRSSPLSRLARMTMAAIEISANRKVFMPALVLLSFIDRSYQAKFCVRSAWGNVPSAFL